MMGQLPQLPMPGWVGQLPDMICNAWGEIPEIISGGKDPLIAMGPR
jgi:hypothetical protein